MKYSIVEIVNKEDISKHINVVYETYGLSFPAVVGNPNYDAFLLQVDLTDEEVHALPVNEWIEA